MITIEQEGGEGNYQLAYVFDDMSVLVLGDKHPTGLVQLLLEFAPRPAVVRFIERALAEGRGRLTFDDLEVAAANPAG